MQHGWKRSALWSVMLMIALAGVVFPAPQGRGGRGGGGNGQGQGGGGQPRGGFPQFTRPLAPQDVLYRGKELYEENCASCHAADLRGGPKGTNLMRSGTALSDQHGELVGAAVAKHTPKLTLVEADTTAITEYIHSIQATAGNQGSPPGRYPQGLQLNVLVGDAKAGETYFSNVCGKCHSVSGDLKGIGAKYSDARALQNSWVAGSGSAAGGGGGGVGGGRRGAGERTATVTMADGSKLEGTLVRKDDFLVILMMDDGRRKSIARNPSTGIPRVDVKDANQAHKEMALELDDPDNQKMHDVTAYLWTIK